MPQMSPILWLNLFLWFSMVFLMFNILNYYFLMYFPPQCMMKFKKKNMPMNWKW